MQIKIKIKPNQANKRHELIIWVQRKSEMENEILQIIDFYKTQLRIEKKWRGLSFFRISSDNVVIMLSILSTLQELMPETFFNLDLEFEEPVDD